MLWILVLFQKLKRHLILKIFSESKISDVCFLFIAFLTSKTVRNGKHISKALYNLSTNFTRNLLWCFGSLLLLSAHFSFMATLFQNSTIKVNVVCWIKWFNTHDRFFLQLSNCEQPHLNHMRSVLHFFKQYYLTIIV